MPRIESAVTVNAPLERVWDVARNVEAFPQFMPDLKSLTVIERSSDGLRTVTEWVGIVKEFKMTVKWTEEDIWDRGAHTCAFRMLKGDLSRYDGVWTFQERDGGVRFESTINWEYDVPLIGPLIKNLIASKMKENAENVIQAIKERSEEQI